MQNIACYLFCCPDVAVQFLPFHVHAFFIAFLVDHSSLVIPFLSLGFSANNGYLHLIFMIGCVSTSFPMGDQEFQTK